MAAKVYAIASFLTPRRKLQLGLLFILQTTSAFLEVISLGALIPFLTVLTDSNRVMKNENFAWLFTWLDIQSQKDLVFISALFFSVTVAIANTGRLLTLWAQVKLAAAIGSDLSVQVYRKTLNQPYLKHLNTNSSSIISSLTHDLAIVLNCLQQIFLMTTNALVASGLLLTMTVVNPLLTLGCGTFIIAAYAAIASLSHKRLVNNSIKISDYSRHLFKAMQEGFGGIRDVLVNNNQNFYANIYAEADRPLRQRSAENAFIGQSPRYILEALAVVALGVFTVIYLNDGHTQFVDLIPVLGAAVLAASRLLPTVQTGYQAYTYYRGAGAALSRIFQILELPEPKSLGSIAPMGLQTGLALDNVWFAYTENRQVLRGLNIYIPARTTVAFVGQTGCGKSTTADLILGLLQPSRGQLVADGMTLDVSTLPRWQASVAHVPQSIFLSDATIAENIAFGVPLADIDMPRVEYAAKLAQLDEFIVSRPRGYDELVGERGVRLSGGQRQRLGIARALYRPSDVIVFDEATSALDNVTESDVMEAIRGLRGKVTIILIAHRLSTVKFADTIFEFENGTVQATGSFEQLIESSASFRKMVGAD